MPSQGHHSRRMEYQGNRQTSPGPVARKGGHISLAKNEVSARINAPWAQSRPMRGAIWNRSSPQLRGLNMFYENAGWNKRDAHGSEGGDPFSACCHVIPTSRDARATFGPSSLSYLRPISPLIPARVRSRGVARFSVAGTHVWLERNRVWRHPPG